MLWRTISIFETKFIVNLSMKLKKSYFVETNSRHRKALLWIKFLINFDYKKIIITIGSIPQFIIIEKKEP